MSWHTNFQYFIGFHGRFNLTAGGKKVTTHYVQTRVRAWTPPNTTDPSEMWDSTLAGHMRPWREIFATDKMSFDALVQRDLDDARVAYDLIPYLLGRHEKKYPIFPPILAILVPKAKRGGIEEFYPQPTREADKVTYGSVFSVSSAQIMAEGKPMFKEGSPGNPTTMMGYSPNSASFVIVDGQHRAMALLALHRQASHDVDWSRSPYSVYYKHIKAEEEMLKELYLPVCVLYFPELFEGSEEAERNEASLTTLCRQVFLDVNKTAKRVSRSREMLLDDENFDAILMRRALSALREGSGRSSSRIFNFDYGRDSESDYERTGSVSKTTMYSTSTHLAKIAGALCFGRQDAFTLRKAVNVADGRNRRNPERPRTLLGSPIADQIGSLSLHHAKHHSKETSEDIVDQLFAMWRPVIPGMYNTLRPFTVHNESLSKLRDTLDDPNVRDNNPLMNKVFALLFEGSGARSVFDEYGARLKEVLTEGELLRKDFIDEDSVNAARTNYTEIVAKLVAQEATFERIRACGLMGISFKKFEDDWDDDDRAALLSRADSIFSAFSTQALQIGYAMAVATLAEYLCDAISGDDGSADYELRCSAVRACASLFVAVTNAYFSPNDDVVHVKLKGYVEEPRAQVFEPDNPGWRSILNMAYGTELSERRWSEFRDFFVELLFAPHCLTALGEALSTLRSEGGTGEKLAATFVDAYERLSKELGENRKALWDKAVDRELKTDALLTDIAVARKREEAAGASEEEIEREIEQLKKQAKDDVLERINGHMDASFVGHADQDAETTSLWLMELLEKVIPGPAQV